jgi:hypothetical protein
LERIATVDEQPATWNERSAQTGKRKRTSRRIAAVERANANRTGDVVTVLSGFELKFLDCNLTRRQPAG